MNYMYRLPKASCQIERVIADLRVLRRTDWEVAGGFLFLTAPAKRVNIIYREEPLSRVLKQVAAKRVKVLSWWPRMIDCNHIWEPDFRAMECRWCKQHKRIPDNHRVHIFRAGPYGYECEVCAAYGGTKCPPKVEWPSND